MIDQLLNLVRQFGQDTVVNNPDVPNEYNQDVMADATRTISSGFQNVLAGGGLENILDLFKGNTGNGSGGGIAGLLKNPMVTMMVGHFISKLVGKYKLSPSSASQVANQLIPQTLSNLITETRNPDNPSFTLDGLIGSLTGGERENAAGNSGGFSLQNLLDSFTGSSGQDQGNSGFNLQDLVGNLTRKAQDNFENQDNSGSGLLDMIKKML